MLALLDRHVTFMPDTVPSSSASTRLDIERVAEKVRLQFGLGLDTPIDSMMLVLENAGVIVHRFRANAPKVDAFSRPIGHKVVVLNSDKGGCEPTRWDMAHELGHLILHAGMEAGGQTQEQEAEWFAAAFLLPRTGFIRSFSLRPVGALDVASLMDMKAIWKVTLPVLVRRAYDLERISASYYHRAFKTLARRGLTGSAAHEPNEGPEEPAEMFEAGLNVLFSEGASAESVARELGWTTDTLRKVIDIPPATAPTAAPLEATRGDDERPWARHLSLVPRRE
jgi:Zn-dependent peptidase ImmA (M78 family)